ncbi:hypothetical protein ACFLTP_03040 [Chloroflexota bacterium]
MDTGAINVDRLNWLTDLFNGYRKSESPSWGVTFNLWSGAIFGIIFRLLVDAIVSS